MSSGAGDAAPTEGSARPARSRHAGHVQHLALTVLPNGFEVSVHTLPKSVARELRLVFPDLLSKGNVLAVPTCQRSQNDLLQMGPEIAKEKDDLLERFFEFSKAMQAELAKGGHWTDFIDPCSGLPHDCDAGNVVYPEVDGFETLLRFPVSSAAGCRVILHPAWGSHVYPATLFTNAPPEAVEQALRAVGNA